MPADFSMSPALNEKFQNWVDAGKIDFDISIAHKLVPDIIPAEREQSVFSKYYDYGLRPGTDIDIWGVAREPGSAESMHMMRMRHPMKDFDSLEQIAAYPFPDFSKSSRAEQEKSVYAAKYDDFITMGKMPMTIWETSWYLRGMENLMVDMMSDDPIAEALFNRVTEIAVIRAKAFAMSGVDILFIGDDIGMQRSIMMKESLYSDWLKPRLKEVINAAKAINPDIVVIYHSCGFITPMIPHLVEAGIDVLNPIQPECMDFGEIYDLSGKQLSFHGTIGTQSVMPFGTPDEVRNAVFKNLDIAGEMGGLLVAPTHLLEPDVPVENVVAYLKACIDYK